MIAIFISAFYTIFLMLIFGLVTSRLLKLPVSFIEKLLLGLVVSNTLATIASLIVPLNTLTALVFLGGAIVGAFFVKQDIRKYFRKISRQRKILFFSLPFWVVALFLALSQPINFDTALYHVQNIKWIEAYPVVPGLANIHGRLGFNNNNFTFVALTSIYQIFQQEIFSVNFVVFCLLVCYFIRRLFQIYKEERYSSLFFFNLFIFLRLLILNNLASPSPDFLSTVIPFFIYSKTYDLLQKPDLSFKVYVPIIIFTVYALTIKLSVIPLIIIPLFILWKYRKDFYSYLPGLLTSTFLIVVPWLLRNIILTGWIIYPFESLDLFDFDWKVPIEDVFFESILIKGTGRMAQGMVCVDVFYEDFMGWFFNWPSDKSFTSIMAFGISFLMPIIVLSKVFLQSSKENIVGGVLFSITGFFGVVFWVLMAPSWRFGEPFVLLGAAAPILLLKTNDKESSILSKILIAVYCSSLMVYSLNLLILIVLMVYIIVVVDIFSAFSKKHYLMVFWGTLLIVYAVRAQSILLNFNKSYDVRELVYTPLKMARVPNESLHFNTQIIDGYEIYEPEIGDRCYDYPIPCTGYANENHRLTNNSKHKEHIPKKSCLTERVQFRGTTLSEGFRRLNPQ